MKKQILILTFILVASIASISNVFGQNATPGSAPMPLTCSDGALTPMAGKSYDYQAEFAPTGGDAYWYATKSTTFMTLPTLPCSTMCFRHLKRTRSSSAMLITS